MSHTKASYLALVVIGTLSCSVFASKEAARSYVSGNYFLALDGVKCGFVKSVDGGGITAEVINEPAGQVPLRQEACRPAQVRGLPGAGGL